MHSRGYKAKKKSSWFTEELICSGYYSAGNGVTPLNCNQITPRSRKVETNLNVQILSRGNFNINQN